jgi:hypothetical protein
MSETKELQWIDVNERSPEPFKQVQVRYMEGPEVLGDWIDANGHWVIANIYSRTPISWQEDNRAEEDFARLVLEAEEKEAILLKNHSVMNELA